MEPYSIQALKMCMLQAHTPPGFKHVDQLGWGEVIGYRKMISGTDLWIFDGYPDLTTICPTNSNSVQPELGIILTKKQ